MHKIDIPHHLIERIVSRRGRQHIFDDLDPVNTAHLVVDLQNGFMAPGAVCEVVTAREIVPNVNRISAALRAKGGLNVFIQNTIDAKVGREWTTYLDRFSSPARRARLEEAFAPGAEGQKLWPELEIAPADFKVPKYRYGAFVEGSSDLHGLLQARGIRTVIVTGTATNVCCESTARDAMMLNYEVIFVSDGTAALSDTEHNATLGNLLGFADVMSTEEVIAAIG